MHGHVHSTHVAYSLDISIDLEAGGMKVGARYWIIPPLKNLSD